MHCDYHCADCESLLHVLSKNKSFIKKKKKIKFYWPTQFFAGYKLWPHNTTFLWAFVVPWVSPQGNFTIEPLSEMN